MKIKAVDDSTVAITGIGRPISKGILEHLNRELGEGLGNFTHSGNDTVHYRHNRPNDPLKVAQVAYNEALYTVFGRQRVAFVQADGSERVIDDIGETCPTVIGDRMTVEVRMDEPWSDGYDWVRCFYIVTILPREITQSERTELRQGLPDTLNASLFDDGHHAYRIDYLTGVRFTTPYEVADTVGNFLAKYFGFEGYLLIMLNGTARYVTVMP